MNPQRDITIFGEFTGLLKIYLKDGSHSGSNLKSIEVMKPESKFKYVVENGKKYTEELLKCCIRFAGFEVIVVYILL